MACCYASSKIAQGSWCGILIWGKRGGSNPDTVSNVMTVTDRRRVLGFELYEFNSSSWKVLDDVTPHWDILSDVRSVSLKGNAYFTAHKNTREEWRETRRFLCFDFTTERFGPLLPLPFQSEQGGLFTSLSVVREEQLAVSYQHRVSRETVEISVTDKIGPHVVSWTKFLRLVTSFCVQPYSGSFFVEEEKKTAVFFVLESVNACCYQTAHLIGQDGYFKSLRIREAPYPGNDFYPRIRYCAPLVCASYLPSLVQLQIKQPTVLMERM
ncbi:hypothetical protein Bca52824_028954 [Brassica carinata]|uniref:F-box associated beta-propeller type 1 domain-containing protein n=1 Tax=Brassica carinata TaxID=52824 RepID=A0A8X7VDD5_BRACI|nr:hypothetical protein Bca52824_028954 [Brassica carinata]